MSGVSLSSRPFQGFLRPQERQGMELAEPGSSARPAAFLNISCRIISFFLFHRLLFLLTRKTAKDVFDFLS